MKKTVFGLCIVLFFSLKAFSQTYQRTAQGIRTAIDSTVIEIQFYNSSIVRVIKWPNSMSSDKQSLSVIKQPEQTNFDVQQSGKQLILTSSKVKVLVSLQSGQVTFSTIANNSLLSEKETAASFTPFNDAGTKSFKVAQVFKLEKDESIFGLGQQQDGKMIQRNLSLNMVQHNTYDYVPFFVSDKGYGLFWDNYSPTLFEDNEESTLFKSDVGNIIDYYFMYGGNIDSVIGNMRSLTGQAPMFPLWTYGYWQSRERYTGQDELVEVVKKYRDIHVPLDGIIQDWQYWGDNNHWNAMEFLNPGFYNPQKMINDVHSLNAHMAISIWSSFGQQTKQFAEMKKINALMTFKTWPTDDYPAGVKVYDPYNPEARNIYWRYLNKNIFSLGMDAWWMDSTEPDCFDIQDSDYNHKTYLGSYRKVKNAFPLMTVGGVYDHQRAETDKKRVFILTRSAFAGQQRYGANTWSGDVLASWDNLRNQISAGLNFSLSGIPYWNSDIGGFFLGEYPRHLKDPSYKELYARWVQFGAFCPMMRSHGTDAPREIYQFGSKGDKVFDAIEKYIRLRYQLLPYIYSAAWDVTNKQSTLMRALVMDFTNDKNAIKINDEFMFGKSILVSPVTNLMYSKLGVVGKDTLMVEDFSSTKTKKTYLPGAGKWIDFWNGNTIDGGKSIETETPLDIMPLFVRAGSIIPIGPDVQYATEKKWDDLEIRIYPGADGSFNLYEDENDNYNYEKGAYSTISFNWNDKNKTLTIGNRKGSFPGLLEERKFTIVIVHPGNDGISVVHPDKIISYKGEQVSLDL